MYGMTHEEYTAFLKWTHQLQDYGMKGQQACTRASAEIFLISYKNPTFRDLLNSKDKEESQKREIKAKIENTLRIRERLEQEIDECKDELYEIKEKLTKAKAELTRTKSKTRATKAEIKGEFASKLLYEQLEKIELLEKENKELCNLLSKVNYLAYQIEPSAESEEYLSTLRKITARYCGLAKYQADEEAINNEHKTD